MDAYTETLVKERESLVTRAQAIKDTALEQKRDLNESDKTALGAYSERVKELDSQLLLATTSFDLDADIADRLNRINPGSVSNASHVYRTAGELMWDVLHRTSDTDAKMRFDGVMRRAAQHMGTSAAATTPTAGGMGGLVVSPVVGPVIDVNPQGRPFLTAIGVRDAPAPLSFMRPRIVDPDFETGVAVQTLQKAELASKKFDIAVDTLTLVTVGGYLNVSEQLRALVAGALDLIVAQLNRRLAWATEKTALAELAESTAKITLSATATGAEILQAIFDASALVFENTGMLAEWILMGPQGWARLGGLVDLANRPLFPSLGAANAMGGADAATFTMAGPAGLRAIVTPAMTDDTFWVGNAMALEAYEYRYPLLEAVEPSLLGRQIAVASSLVCYRPTTAEGAPPVGNGAVHLAP